MIKIISVFYRYGIPLDLMFRGGVSFSQSQKQSGTWLRSNRGPHKLLWLITQWCMPSHDSQLISMEHTYRLAIRDRYFDSLCAKQQASDWHCKKVHNSGNLPKQSFWAGSYYAMTSTAAKLQSLQEPHHRFSHPLNWNWVKRGTSQNVFATYCSVMQLIIFSNITEFWHVRKFRITTRN